MNKIEFNRIGALRPVATEQDTDGAAIVLVTLVNGEKAKLLLEDFNALMQKGVSPNWRRNSTSKSVNVCSTWSMSTPVSRLLVGVVERPDLWVSYKDGDRLNLRRDNLIVRPAGRVPVASKQPLLPLEAPQDSSPSPVASASPLTDLERRHTEALAKLDRERGHHLAVIKLEREFRHRLESLYAEHDRQNRLAAMGEAGE